MFLARIHRPRPITSVAIQIGNLLQRSSSNQCPTGDDPPDARCPKPNVYAAQCENQVNVQIGNELAASHTYLTMAAHCARVNVGLVGAAGFFLLQSDEEREHAHHLCAHQIMRGGRVVLPTIAPAPGSGEWKTLEQLFNGALETELKNLESLQTLHDVAEANGDTVLDEQISEFLVDQLKEIHQFKMLLTQLRLSNPDAGGSFLFDKYLGEKFPYKGENAFLMQ